MKKLLVLLLIILPVYLTINIYLLDKEDFVCPIQYKHDFVVRNDSYGDGYFGCKRSGGRKHDGIDLLAEVGTPVLACKSGWVIAATQSRGMGKYVIVRHSKELISIYGHLSRISVDKGQFVRQAEVIGRVGKTGNANYKSMLAHLHFEIRKNGIPVDPLKYIQ